MKRARQILSSRQDHTFRLHLENLESILLADDVMDKPVVLISVAGAFRKGKSFLLDTMLRYLCAGDKTNWMNEKQSQGLGFPWQGGYKRHTTGMLMSSPVPVTLPSGEEAVVLLMDTQGAFDNKSTVAESATVFALSTLLSSLVVFNLMNNVQNDDLEHLQLFTEYGRMALSDDGSGAPFQKLLFLIRDWQFTETSLGAAGGKEVIDEWLQEPSGNQEQANVRKHIRDCFTEISGFLLPYPGKKVACGQILNVCAEDMEEDFVQHLKDLMPILLAPENLTIKTVAGNAMKARDLVNYLKMYLDLFKGDKIPKPQNILQVTAETNNMVACQEARSQYIKDMESVLGGDKPALNEADLFRHHTESTRRAEVTFKNRKKMGDWKVSEVYYKKLLKEMEKWFKPVESLNKMKREEERLRAEKFNASLTESCKATYMQAMQAVADEEVGHVAPEELDRVHDCAKEKALAQFDAEKAVAGKASEFRCRLVDAVHSEHKQITFHNQVKKDERTRQCAQETSKAVRMAKECYQALMDIRTQDKSIPDDALRLVHQESLQAAEKLFEGVKQGSESFCSTYLADMISDIESKFGDYQRSVKNATELGDLKGQISALEAKVKEHKKTLDGKWCSVM